MHPGTKAMVQLAKATGAGRTMVANAMGPTRYGRGLALCIVALALAGCAGSRAFKEGQELLAQGQLEGGLAKLEEAGRIEPDNAGFRIAARSERLRIVQRFITLGDLDSASGRLDDAENAYRRAMDFDPRNAMAQRGLEAIEREHRHQAAASEVEKMMDAGGPDDLARARKQLRTVLQENPRQRQAVQLQSRLDATLAKTRSEGGRLAQRYRQPVSLEFQEAPFRTVFSVLSSVSGISFFFDKDLKSDLRISVMARNTTVEDAIRLLLATNQLEQKVLNNRSILIYPNTPQKQREYQTLAVRTFYLANANVAAVSNTIKSIVKTKDLIIDERLGLIIMRDTPQAIAMAQRLVELQDLGDPEVMLEVEVAEVSRTRLLELGVSWPEQLSLSPLASGSTLTLQDLLNLNRSRIQASIGSLTINAHQDDTDVSILANPRIRVRNKEKAKIMIGSKVPVITTTASSTGFVSESVNYLDVGLKLEVEPNIYLDAEVGINVALEVSSIVSQVQSAAGTLAYQIGTRGANTVLRLRDGETQILAGLINSEDRARGSKVPVLGSPPVLDRLFGSRADDTTRNEILLSITPRIVRAIRRPDLLAAEFDSGTESNIGSGALLLSDVEETPNPRSAGTRASAPPPLGSGVGIRGDARAQSSSEQGPTMALSLRVPRQAKTGEVIDVELNANQVQALNEMRMLLSYDPRVLAVDDVLGGTVPGRGGAPPKVEWERPEEGQIAIRVAAMPKQQADGEQIPAGRLLTLKVRALRPAAQTPIRVLSAQPQPALSRALAVPMEGMLRVVP